MNNAPTPCFSKEFPSLHFWKGSRLLGMLIGLCLLASVTFAMAATWSPAGTLASGRYNHSATLLSDGKVLVVGGESGGTDMASAELYDPTSNSWSPAGLLAAARSGHTATLLSNGKVLVAGGYGDSGILASVELYDPSTNSWSGTGSLLVARTKHSATLLSNGKVLVAGGAGSAGYLASAELYDPTANSWSVTGSLATERNNHVAILLSNGKILIPGGDYSGGPLASCELYDPATGVWSAAGSLSIHRSGHTVTLLLNGKVLAAGGHTGEGTFGYSTSTELYDPVSNTWSAAASLSYALFGHTATLLGNGNVLVVQARDQYYVGYNLPISSLYDPVTNAWSSTAVSNSGRVDHTATLLANGDVLVAGGYSGALGVASAERYSTATVPGAPAIGAATGGNAQATVTFSAPASNGGSAITGYTVTSNPAGGIDSNAGSTNLSHVMTGLSNGVGYTFTVAATNSNGLGPSSAASNSVTPGVVPGAPTISTITAGKGSATIAFSAPGSPGSSAIVSYTGTCSAAGKTTKTASGANTPIKVLGLVGGVSYSCVVAATNATGTGVPSLALSVVPNASSSIITILMTLLLAD